MPSSEREVLAQPIPTAGGRVIVSPFQFQTTGEDNLKLEGWSSLANCVLVVQGRRFDEFGKQQAFAFKVALTSNRVAAEQTFPLGKGYLVNLVAFIEGASPLIGQCFTCIKLVRGLSGATITLGLLVQGYLTHEQGLAWPGSPLMDSLSGSGLLRTITGTDPAAGVEISETVPTGARWEFVSTVCIIQCSATAATRQPILTYDNGSAQYFNSRNPGTAIASDLRGFVWAQGMPLAVAIATGTQTAGLPTNVALLAGGRIRTSTTGLQVGDNWQAPIYVVREWLEAN